ncbi:hypothetical protein SESBI_06215 [Sesbania bispinosa]|nr:hypothetical protein SESBI_06215 [Sesbania bispinosa]
MVVVGEWRKLACGNSRRGAREVKRLKEEEKVEERLDIGVEKISLPSYHWQQAELTEHLPLPSLDI